MKILIVEDEAIIAMDLALTLRSLGVEDVYVASSAEEGLCWLQNLRPDLIFMDIKLKGMMDGVEAAMIIQQRGPFPLIYITAYADEITLSRASQVSHLGILQKPFTDEELRRVLQRVNS